jgi:hypothetical protein
MTKGGSPPSSVWRPPPRIKGGANSQQSEPPEYWKMFRPFCTTSLCVLTLICCDSLLAGQKSPVSNTCFLSARVSMAQSLDSLLLSGFSKSLLQVLAQKFPAINLCMDTCKDSCGHLPLLKLQVSFKKPQDTLKTMGEILVTSKNIIRYQKKQGAQITQLYDMRLITSFQIPAGTDISGLYLIVAEKIVENVRQQALCEVKISAKPSGSQFFIDSSFTGISPKTVLLPPGTYSVRATAPGYLPFISDLDVQPSGITLFDARLVKRRFYHSRCMLFVELFGAAAAASFAGEWYYNGRYHALGEDDFHSQPELFGKTFNAAKRLEYAGFTLLGLSGSCLCFSFFF